MGAEVGLGVGEGAGAGARPLSPHVKAAVLLVFTSPACLRWHFRSLAPVHTKEPQAASAEHHAKQHDEALVAAGAI